MEVEKSTWQNRCVLRYCASVDVMRHAFHPARILRAQAIRSKWLTRLGRRESRHHQAPSVTVIVIAQRAR